MFLAMLAYLVWIVLTLVALGLVFHILHMDRPRLAELPVGSDDLS